VRATRIVFCFGLERPRIIEEQIMSEQPDNQKRSKGPELTKETSQADAVYKVGPGRPPREFQFKPGQSGNPGGRPKNRLSFARELADALAQLVADGDNRRITNKGSIVNTVMAAARRNPKYALALIDLCEKLGGHDADPSGRDDDAYVESLVGGEAAAAEDFGGSSTQLEQTEISRRSPDEETEQ
jgi:antitoxin (DNA-binding transcriptional repressor) of toxin-antitoxin stability system